MRIEERAHQLIRANYLEGKLTIGDLTDFASEAVKAREKEIADELETLGIKRLAFQAYVQELRNGGR